MDPINNNIRHYAKDCVDNNKVIFDINFTSEAAVRVDPGMNGLTR